MPQNDKYLFTLNKASDIKTHYSNRLSPIYIYIIKTTCLINYDVINIVIEINVGAVATRSMANVSSIQL